MKVLLTEDQPIVIKMLSEILQNIFVETEICKANSISTAEALLKNISFDLIIADLDYDGEKRFNVLEIANDKKIPCIVYTGHYNMAFIKRAFSLHAIAFISKLGETSDLEYAIRNHRTIRKYICSYCVNQHTSKVENEIIFPELKPIEEYILNKLLIQTPRKFIAKELKITSDSLNTYINRMTAKNNCNLLVLIHRYIVWKKGSN